jgi:polyisoprenoid-binding protein YceI
VIKRILPAAALAAALAFTLPLGAQMKAPGTRDASLVTAGTWQTDPGHTMVVWTVDHMGFTPYTGIFGDVSGTLQLDPKNPAAAKIDVTIPVAKVTTASAGLTTHLLKAAPAGGKADFFGAAPADAHFVSTKVEVTGSDSATITGDLTLNGVTKPVTLKAMFYGAGKMPAMMGGKDGLGFVAGGTIKRSEFGVGYGVPMISDEVSLKIYAGFGK